MSADSATFRLTESARAFLLEAPKNRIDGVGAAPASTDDALVGGQVNPECQPSPRALPCRCTPKPVSDKTAVNAATFVGIAKVAVDTK